MLTAHCFSKMGGIPSGPTVQAALSWFMARMIIDSSTSMCVKDSPRKGTSSTAASTCRGVIASLEKKNAFKFIGEKIADGLRVRAPVTIVYHRGGQARFLSLVVHELPERFRV